MLQKEIEFGLYQPKPEKIYVTNVFMRSHDNCHVADEHIDALKTPFNMTSTSDMVDKHNIGKCSLMARVPERSCFALRSQVPPAVHRALFT